MSEDPYAVIADLYDFAYGEDLSQDLDFYENLARSVDGPLLELGVGTGRLAVPLAAAGFDVVGLDSSPSMLERARANLEAQARGAPLELVAGDMTRFDLGRSFGLVFVAANTFQHLLRTAEQVACVRCVARHLAPGGLFVISVRSPTSVSWEDAGAPAPLLLDWTVPDPRTGDLVMKYVAVYPDPAKMTRRLTYVYDRVREGQVHRTVFQTELRYCSSGEMESLLQHEGLRVTHLYGDYDLSPVSETTDNLIFVARAEKSR